MKDYARIGLEIGEHISDFENFTGYIEENFDLDKLDFVLIMMKPVELPRSLWNEWAEFFKKNRIYFAFLYTQQRGAPKGKISHLTEEIVKDIKIIAGEYFVGDMIGETGGMASWLEGYYEDLHMEKVTYETMSQAKQAYVDHVKSRVEIDRKFNVPSVLAVEATVFNRYNFEAGVDHTAVEMMCGNPEIMFASARGACKAYGKDIWSSHIANEWYGGFRNDDPLKYKRLKIAYYYSFLAGAKYIYPESGDISISSYGYHYDSNHDFCKTYRKTWSEFADFVHLHGRPQGGPKTKIAFMHGNLDSYTGWGGSTVWNHFRDENWSYGPAERGWKVIDEDIFTGTPWYNPHNYGEQDTSFSVPYGQYDIVPTEAPLDTLLTYDYLIFVGWNTMTPDIYEKLKAYVSNGGNLFASIPHLNTKDTRDEDYRIIQNGDVSDLFGCIVTGPGRKHAWGVKFIEESSVDQCLYPCTKDGMCDPICAEGIIKSADISLKGGRIIALLSDRFSNKMDNCPPILVENTYGKGTATLLTAWEYPGADSLRKLFKTILKSILSGEQRKADVKVIGNDKIRYGVYPGNGLDTLYILNTDYNNMNKAHIRYKGIDLELEVDSCEIRAVYMTDRFICSPIDNKMALDDIRLSQKDCINLIFKGSGSRLLEWALKDTAAGISVNHEQIINIQGDEHFVTMHQF